MMREIRRWLIIAFIALTVAVLVWFKMTQPRVLVLQSYNTDYAWARDIDIGIRRVLDGDLNYKIRWHYMDTKRHQDVAFKIRAGMLALRQIEAFHPKVIIAVDDDAQKYAVMKYANDPNISIVFAGINGGVTQYGYDHASNVTGIYERKPLRNLRDALVAMHYRDGKPLGRRIAHIGDESSSVIEDSKIIETMDWSPFRLVSSRHVSTFDEWKKAVMDASRGADVIVISNYHKILRKKGDKLPVPHSEVMKWTEEHSKVPVVGMGGFMVEDGGMFAVGASGFEQGETIAHMAEKIIDKHVKAGDIPQVMPRQYLVYIRQSEMDKRRLVLPDIYEAFSRASNNYH